MAKREKIKLKGETYEVGFSFRAIKEYEELTGKSVSECTSTYDKILYYYSTLKALNKSFGMDLDKFLDILDDKPDLLIELQSISAQETVEVEEGTTKKKAGLKTFFGLWMLSFLLLLAPVALPITFGTIWIFRSLKLLVKLIVKIGKKRG